MLLYYTKETTLLLLLKILFSRKKIYFGYSIVFVRWYLVIHFIKLISDSWDLNSCFLNYSFGTIYLAIVFDQNDLKLKNQNWISTQVIHTANQLHQRWTIQDSAQPQTRLFPTESHQGQAFLNRGVNPTEWHLATLQDTQQLRATLARCRASLARW